MDNIEFSLRPLRLEDAKRMLEWMRDPDITKYLQIGGPDTSKESVEAFIRNSADECTNLHRAVINRDGEYLGTISLKHIDKDKGEAEYAISMHKSALGSGAAAQASRLLLEMAFVQFDLKRVYLNVLSVNQRAVKFYEKFGFQYTHVSPLQINGVDMELRWYEVSKETFLRM